MIDISTITTIAQMEANMKELFIINKESKKMIDILKDKVKYNKETLEWEWAKLEYSSYNKYVPVDMDKILEKYPIAIHPEMYKITLTAEAADIITEWDLLEQKEIFKCIMKID